MLAVRCVFVVVAALVSSCSKAETKVVTPVAVVNEAPGSQPAATHDDDTHHDATAELKIDREQVDADGVVRRGAKLSDLQPLTVAEATARPDIDGKVTKITGSVESVCQPMGCWMVLAGDKPEQRVRITSKGHDIFMPRSSAGRIATVEGEFKLKVLPMATAQHYEDERELKAGEVKKVFTEDQKEFSVSIVGVELKPAA